MIYIFGINVGKFEYFNYEFTFGVLATFHPLFTSFSILNTKIEIWPHIRSKKLFAVKTKICFLRQHLHISMSAQFTTKLGLAIRCSNYEEC
jgi:hypothetical protein